ncbi:hypothetical protein QBC35DRAFT_508357 [Podospora australis]|uniref:Uncharacterized protein n=1 Tax=Podospora australis TaxID=1536484 RepID=A0AAN7AE57_9PEZI|nr:hypothetical protein QBC35DRAFT_508357 [Podospora australis]
MTKATTPSAPEQPTTFHGSAYFPYELREAIWKMSIRPKGAAVHYFYVHESKDVDNNPNKKIRTMGYSDPNAMAEHNGMGNDAKSKYQICAPRATTTTSSDPEEEVYTWNAASNNSVYMWDAGLWGACAESRRIVTKEWKARVQTDIAEEKKLFEIDVQHRSPGNPNERRNMVDDVYNRHYMYTSAASVIQYEQDPGVSDSVGKETGPLLVSALRDLFVLDIQSSSLLRDPQWLWPEQAERAYFSWCYHLPPKGNN